MCPAGFIYLSRMDNKRAVAEKLLQINAIKLSPQQPFTWASGGKVPSIVITERSYPFHM